MKEQSKQISKGLLIALIAIVSAAPPIATDLFLPAIPDMPAYFGTSTAVINLALVSFYVFMAVGLLVFGPLSDKYGRRPILLVSLLLFIVSAALCALSNNIWLIILERVFQGMGGGGMVAMGTALVKDCFEGEERQRVLVVTMAISVVAPMGAPVLGAAILSFTTWQGTFVAQGTLAVLALPITLVLREPLAKEDRITEGVIGALGRLAVVGRNASFILPLLLCALAAAPYMTYISAASYIYTGTFGLSKLSYSLFFAANAVLSAAGAGLVIIFQNRIAPKVSAATVFVVSLISGILILTVGHVSPFIFLVCYGLYTLGGGFLRPVSTAVLLEQQRRDTGSASSLINTAYTLLGSCGMVMATLPWSDCIDGLGITITITSIVVILLGAILLKSSVQIKGID